MDGKKGKHNQKPKHPQPMLELAWFALASICIKLLLIPSYHSTDFEVHRNWLALTHSLPLSKWYVDETSQWTLDYPPFFAYSECFLSIFASFIDPQIVDLHKGINYDSNTVIYFQRVSVIVSDIVLFCGVYLLTKNLNLRKRFMVWILLIWSPSLILVDHMHFQYNGFLLGFLLISLSYLEEGRDLMGGFVFVVILCLKHLFAVAAPVYFVYLLRHYCWRGGLFRTFGRLLMMGSVVAAVFAVAFGPFFYHGQIQQVLHRMFPFGRGLCHSYWAPNFWVFYIMLDKGIAFLLRTRGYNIQKPEASFTGGLVGDSSPFFIFPQATPLTTFIMVLLALLPCLIKVWRDPRPKMITRWIAYAYTCGFLFGWHVHEKASLHFVIPLAIVAMHSSEEARHYFLLSIVSCYSLFPLLFQAQEYPVKVLLLLSHSTLMWLGFSSYFSSKPAVKANPSPRKRGGKSPASIKVKEVGFTVGKMGMNYLLGLLAVEIWGQFLHPFFLGDRLPFVPLMLISVYCALGIMYSWLWQLRSIIRAP